MNKINSEDRYGTAVEDAITAEKNRLFEEDYNEMKETYDIFINFEYWDSIKIGSILSIISF